MRRVIAAIVMLICARGWAANLVPNPSAEAGDQAPDSWHAIPAARGFWHQGGARFGERCLGLDASERPAAWRTKATYGTAFQGYRLSGWIRSEGGTGWIEARFLGLHGRCLNIVRTPVTRERSWAYVAVEIPAASAPGGSPHILCRAEKGRCLFDGIRLASLDRNILPNPGLEPLLIDDKPDPGGQPAAWHALPETDARPLTAIEPAPGGGRGITLGGEHPSGAASYLVDLPERAKTCHLGMRMVTDGAVRCALSWFGPQGFIRDDAFVVRPRAEVDVGVGLGGGAIPAGANRVQAAFCLVEGSSAMVIPAWLVAVTEPEPPRVAVFANQVGYEPEGTKTAIVASSAFPARLEDAQFAVVNEAGARVFSGGLVPLGRVHEGEPDDWSSYYWLADFSQVRNAGRFRIRAKVGQQIGTSHPFQIARGIVFQQTAELTYRFLYYQRCGCAVPGWHGPCHLDDARLPDGTHLSLAGGWHDAGDYNKWMYPEGPPLVLYGLASAYLAHRQFFDAIDRDGNGRSDLLDEILWGADWLTRMRNPKTGGLFGSITRGWSYWGLAERETDNIPGNEDDRPVGKEDPSVALAAAALAKVAQCVTDGQAFARAAAELEAYARKKERHGPDHLLACLAIWQATGQQEYLEEARAAAEGIAGAKAPDRQGRALAALALFVASVAESGREEKCRRAIEDSIAWLSGRQTQPYAVAAGRTGIEKDMQEQSRLGGMASHMALTSNAWAALACARAIGSHEAVRAAFNELDWLFGLNPLDLCMLQGAGSLNPPRYHHRYFDNPNHRDGAVPGAIPNGIARPNRQPSLDVPFFDWVHRDPMTAEPWIPYNGYYLCVLGLMDAGM